MQLLMRPLSKVLWNRHITMTAQDHTGQGVAYAPRNHRVTRQIIASLVDSQGLAEQFC